MRGRADLGEGNSVRSRELHCVWGTLPRLGSPSPDWECVGEQSVYGLGNLDRACKSVLYKAVKTLLQVVCCLDFNCFLVLS